MSVNDVTPHFPDTVAIFNTFGIDARNGGATLVAGAAQRDGAGPAALVAASCPIVEAGS